VTLHWIDIQYEVIARNEAADRHTTFGESKYDDVVSLSVNLISSGLIGIDNFLSARAGLVRWIGTSDRMNRRDRV